MAKSVGKRRQSDFREQILHGLELEQAGRMEEAQRVYDAILEVDPRHSFALHRRAVYRAERGDMVEALRLIREAMRTGVTPSIATDCAVMLERLGRIEEAIETCNRALVVDPKNAAVLLRRANLHSKLGRRAEAAASYEKYLERYPQDASAHNLHGLALAKIDRRREALDSYARAIALSPENALFHFHRALELLTLGEFEAGWAEYEWRFDMEDMKASRSPHAKPHWDGKEPLTGKTILLYTEQGLGDSIMFARYANEVAALGAKVVLGVLPAVKCLFEGRKDFTVAAPGDPISFNLQCPLLSLPYFLKTRLDTIPARVPYILPRPDRVEAWRDRIPRGRGKTVGIVWAGGRDFEADRARSIALAGFQPLFDRPDIQFVSCSATCARAMRTCSLHAPTSRDWESKLATSPTRRRSFQCSIS